MKCETGSFNFDKKCYFINKEKRTFCDAFKYCKDKNSSLLSMINSNQNSNYPNELFKLIEYLSVEESYWVKKQIFIRI